jgi:hypothetical protein
MRLLAGSRGATGSAGPPRRGRRSSWPRRGEEGGAPCAARGESLEDQAPRRSGRAHHARPFRPRPGHGGAVDVPRVHQEVERHRPMCVRPLLRRAVRSRVCPPPPPPRSTRSGTPGRRPPRTKHCPTHGSAGSRRSPKASQPESTTVGDRYHSPSRAPAHGLARGEADGLSAVKPNQAKVATLLLALGRRQRVAAMGQCTGHPGRVPDPVSTARCRSSLVASWKSHRSG